MSELTVEAVLNHAVKKFRYDNLVKIVDYSSHVNRFRRGYITLVVDVDDEQIIEELVKIITDLTRAVYGQPFIIKIYSEFKRYNETIMDRMAREEGEK